MRVLILGGDGMLGHQVLKALSPGHDVRVTLRQDLGSYAACGLFTPGNAFAGVDVRYVDRLVEIFAGFRPDAVVNCVGIVKQRDVASDAIPSLEVNALLPHRLASLCKAVGARLIHISTDCVFSGRAGLYRETDFPDCEDLYGRSKLLGEVAGQPHCITLRTSIIGRELSRKTGLLEWFLAQSGTVRGYRRAVFSGLTTPELSRVIRDLLQDHPTASGLYQVSAAPIDKHHLLQLFREHLNHPVEIVPSDDVVIDRSLDSSKFRGTFGYAPPDWPTMISELALAPPSPAR